MHIFRANKNTKMKKLLLIISLFIGLNTLQADTPIKRLYTEPATVLDCNIPEYNRLQVYRDVDGLSKTQRVGYQLNISNVQELHRQGYTGEGVKVAIIDTGIDFNHEDLQNLVYLRIDVTGAPDFPINPHGSHCAGIAGANDNGLGILGIASNIKILDGRGLDFNGSGNSARIAQLIEESADEGVDVISLSLGGSASSNIILQAIRYATSKGIRVFAAMGNDGTCNFLPSESIDDIECGSYPANFVEATGVGNVNQRLEPHQSSSVSSNVFLCAAGTDIVSTIPNNQYAAFTGTSMSTPAIAAMYALLLEKHIKNHKEAMQELVNSLVELDTPEGNKYLDSKGFNKKTGFGLPVFKELVVEQPDTTVVDTIIRDTAIVSDPVLDAPSDETNLFLGVIIALLMAVLLVLFGPKLLNTVQEYEGR